MPSYGFERRVLSFMLFDSDLEDNFVKRDVKNSLGIPFAQSEVYIEKEMDRRALHLTALSPSSKSIRQFLNKLSISSKIAHLESLSF